MKKLEKGNQPAVNVEAISQNLNLIFKTGDINKLNKPTYQFISGLPGFIAHYNLYRFRETYTDLSTLARVLLEPHKGWDPNRRNEIFKMQTDSDFVAWYGQKYCSSKAYTIAGLVRLAKNYLNKI